jgi:hypothetical protein
MDKQGKVLGTHTCHFRHSGHPVRFGLCGNPVHQGRLNWCALFYVDHAIIELQPTRVPGVPSWVIAIWASRWPLLGSIPWMVICCGELGSSLYVRIQLSISTTSAVAQGQYNTWGSSSTCPIRYALSACPSVGLSSIPKCWNPISRTRNSNRRCFILKNSLVPWVASPNATMRVPLSLRMSWSGCRSSNSLPECTVSRSCWSLPQTHAFGVA